MRLMTMYPFDNLHIKYLLESTLELFLLRLPLLLRTGAAAYLSDPRGRQLPNVPENISEEQCIGNTSSLGENPNTEVDTQDVCPEIGTELDPSSSREIARLKGELRHLRDKYNLLQTSLHETQQHIRQKDAQLDQLRERNHKVEEDYQDMRRLADERRLEVKSLETFLTKTDHISGSDLVQSIKDMNSEILQFSAAASESIANQRKDSQSNTSRRKALERVAARFGTKMKQYLEKRDHASDPTILQYALQASLCQCISQGLSSFCYGPSGKLETHLSRIYQHMHTSEPQPVSARWRALTHIHIRKLNPKMAELAINDVTDTCLRSIANVISAAGFGDAEDQLMKVEARYRKQIRRIAEMAEKFALVVREGTISTDFHVLYVESAREFNATSMENLYEGYGPSQGYILCTTDMGLQCVTNRGRDGKEFNDHTIEKHVVLKPRVVFDSVVSILDR